MRFNKCSSISASCFVQLHLLNIIEYLELKGTHHPVATGSGCLLDGKHRPQSWIWSNLGKNPVLLVEFYSKPGFGLLEHQGCSCHIAVFPLVALWAGQDLVLTALQQQKLFMFPWQCSLCLLGPWQHSHSPSHHVFGLAVSLQVTVPICLCSKLLTFNGLTGWC